MSDTLRLTPVRTLHAARLLEGAAFSSLMPFVLLHFTQTLGMTAVASGAVLGARELMPVFTGVAAGWLVGQSGSRSVLGVSLLLLAASTWTWKAGAGGHAALWLAAAVSGMATSAVRVGFSSTVAGLTTKEEAPAAFAMLHACANVGFAVGPLLNAYWVERKDYPHAFLVPIALYLLAGALVFAGIGPRVAKGEEESGQGLSSLLREHGSASLLFLAAVMLVIFFNGVRLQANLLGLGKHFVEHFHSTRATSLYWTAQSLAVVLLVPWGGRWMKGWPTQALFAAFVFGMALIASAFWSLGFFGAQSLGPAFASLVILSVLGECLCVPAYGALLVNLLGQRRAGLAFGLASTVAAVGMSAGASLSGLLLDRALQAHDLPQYWRWIGAICVGAYAVSFVLGALALPATQPKHAVQRA